MNNEIIDLIAVIVFSNFLLIMFGMLLAFAYFYNKPHKNKNIKKENKTNGEFETTFKSKNIKNTNLILEDFKIK